jgi:hypothetical protein
MARGLLPAVAMTTWDSFRVYVRFRSRRLIAARGLDLARALDVAARMRAERFHNPEHVFVANERTGEVVDMNRAVVAELPDQLEYPSFERAESHPEDDALRGLQDAVMSLKRRVDELERLMVDGHQPDTTPSSSKRSI